MCPFLQSVKVPLNGSTTILCINYSSQFPICQLAEVALCAVIQVINQAAKQCWPQRQSLGYTDSYWPPDGLHASDHSP